MFRITKKELKEFAKRKDINIFDITNMSDEELIKCGFLEDTINDNVGNVSSIAYCRTPQGLQGKIWIKNGVFYIMTKPLYRFTLK